MPNMWFQYFPIPDSAKADWLALSNDNAYKVLNATGIPSPISPGLLGNCDTALVLRSGSLGNGDILVYIMANLNRVDHSNIDQMPFGVAIISGDIFTSGVLVHHGNYDPSRTAPASPISRGYVNLTADQQTRFANNFSFSQLPANETGSLGSLNFQSQINALNTVVAELRNQINVVTGASPAATLFPATPPTS